MKTSVSKSEKASKESNESDSTLLEEKSISNGNKMHEVEDTSAPLSKIPVSGATVTSNISNTNNSFQETSSPNICGSKKVLDKKYKFKNAKYQGNGFTTKTKVWKNLKQIISSQKMQSSMRKVTYASIDAPSPITPVKKYSDLSGLYSLYTDPCTKLRYSNSTEYQQIQHLSSETIMGLLILRKADT